MRVHRPVHVDTVNAFKLPGSTASQTNKMLVFCLIRKTGVEKAELLALKKYIQSGYGNTVRSNADDGFVNLNQVMCMWEDLLKTASWGSLVLYHIADS